MAKTGFYFTERHYKTIYYLIILIQTFQQDICTETAYLDNLLHQLRQYYSDIKTKRQLNFEVPAGFRKLTQHQQDYNCHTSVVHPSSQDTSILDNTVIDIEHIPTPAPTSENLEPNPTPTNASPSIIGTPTIRSVDKPSSSLPRTITISEDFLRSCVGFRRIDTIKQHFNALFEDTIKLASLPADAVLDQGDLSTKMSEKPSGLVTFALEFLMGGVSAAVSKTCASPI